MQAVFTRTFLQSWRFFLTKAVCEIAETTNDRLTAFDPGQPG